MELRGFLELVVHIGYCCVWVMLILGLQIEVGFRTREEVRCLVFLF